MSGFHATFKFWGLLGSTSYYDLFDISVRNSGLPLASSAKNTLYRIIPALYVSLMMGITVVTFKPVIVFT
jgi:hypothetical protein